MYAIRPVSNRNCEGLSRRHFLTVGAAAAAGLSLAGLPARAAGSDLSVIFVFLWGGPSQFETFDPKPDASSEVRGPFGVVETSVPGLRFGDQLPRLARLARKFTTLRNLHHATSVHTDAGCYALTGHVPPPGFRPPNHGAVVTRFVPARGALPPAVRTGVDLFDCAGEVRGQDGGFLGGAYAPFVVHDPREPVEKLASLNPPENLTGERLGRRRTLRESFDALQRAVESDAAAAHSASFQRAFSLVTSPEAKRALDLSRETEATRERYGKTLPGCGMLMARRLVEAGVRFVQVNWSRWVVDGGWDTHGTGQNMGGTLPEMKNYLLPTLDQSVSALFEDLETRGLNRNTLVVVCGEFGRTHKISNGGRDHWPGVYPALLYGKGVPEGHVIGESDAQGMYPHGAHLTPADISMTLYRMLGMDVSETLRDARVVEAAPGIPGIG